MTDELVEVRDGTVSIADLLGVRRIEVVPRLAYSPAEAATALGVSRNFFDEHILPELDVIRRGSRRIIPRKSLEAWLDEKGERIRR